VVGESDMAEVAGLFMFVGTKNEAYAVTQVHRGMRCFMNWLVVMKRTEVTMQPIIADAPAAFQKRWQ
jgi:hypothetical protein